MFVAKTRRSSHSCTELTCRTVFPFTLVENNAMKSFILVIVTSLFAGSLRSQTPAEWQADLRHLQQTVHSKYSNLFHTITAAEWDKAVDSFHAVIPKLDKINTIAGFVALVSRFHIGHTQVNTFGFHSDEKPLLSRYPYRLFWFSDGLYILKADQQYERAVGGKIVRIGTMKPEQAIEAIRPLVAYENEQGFKSNVVTFLATPEYLKVRGIAESSEELPVVISKNGKEETVIFKPQQGRFNGRTVLETPAGWVDSKKASSIPLWQKEPGEYRYMEFLPKNKTLYVRHTVTLNDGEKTITDFFSKMADFIDKNDVQKLVLDIRMNGGGNNYLNKRIITSIIESKKINQPGKFFCILGRRTFSAAQNLVNELEKYTEVVFVGEPTSENVNFYGDTRTETLPNTKLQVNLSWMWWQNLDPRDKRTATSPQLAVDMSFDDYYNNNDPALDIIMNYDPSESLLPSVTRMLEAGKKVEALKFASTYQNSPVNRYRKDRIEPEINNEGYRVLAAGKKELASQLLEINTKLFPESANTYDSYAESLLELGKHEEAIKYYEKAIALDKEGVTADNARKMITKIKERKPF